MDDLLTKRRRLLQGVSAGGMAFLAGCSEFLDSDDGDDQPADEEDGVETEPEDEAGDEIPDDEPEEDTPEDDDPNGYTPEDSDDQPEEDTPEEDTDDEPEEDTDEEMTREVGIIVALDEEAIDDLEEGIATGEIDQDELVERQREIIEESVENLVEVLGNETDVEVLEEIPELAAVRVEGRPSELIDVMESAHAQALVPASDLTPS